MLYLTCEKLNLKRMYIKREMENKLKPAAESFPVVAILGPRQSGKTTLARAVFPDKKYVSLEAPDTRSLAQEDPRGFLATYSGGAIIDEIQNVPELFSYIQVMVDERKINGDFILTGSQNFLLHERVSQSLAGRVSILSLLPLSIAELAAHDDLPEDYVPLMMKGLYPRVHKEDEIDDREWYRSYIQTYLERDVRSLKNVNDLGAFQTFVRVCAGRTGQLLNLSALANDCGITYNTAKSWLSVLEASFIVHLLRPHHRNFNKRLTKRPKLHFLDTGLACNLIGISTKEELEVSTLRGPLFESLIISELLKHSLNRGMAPNYYFWRDKLGHEVDCLIDAAGKLTPIEIKSGRTISKDYFKELKYWNDLAERPHEDSFVVYGGTEKQTRSAGKVLGWQDVLNVLADES